MSGSEEWGGPCRQETLLWFLWGGKGQTEQVGLGLANLNPFSGLWSAGAAPGSWAWEIGEQGECSESESPKKEAAEVWALNWLVCI